MSITKAEAESLVDYIEFNLIKDIREDLETDSMQWLVNMIHAYEKLKAIANGENE